MQASTAWTPPTGTLGRIVADARLRATALEGKRSELERLVSAAEPAPPFALSLRRPEVTVIAEVKRRSPSKGWIQPTLDPAEQARAYRAGGAAAISVLTEPEHFAGSTEDLIAVRSAVPLATLKKDFHVAPIQLLEAKALGASAALLIVRALEDSVLWSLIDAARALDLELLVEVRDERELARALDAGATIIGVNNRNLETLAIDLTTSERLLPMTPPGVVAVAESGVRSRADVERAARAGADAVLVGSNLSGASDPVGAVHALTGVSRAMRGG